MTGWGKCNVMFLDSRQRLRRQQATAIQQLGPCTQLNNDATALTGLQNSRQWTEKGQAGPTWEFQAVQLTTRRGAYETLHGQGKLGECYSPSSMSISCVCLHANGSVMAVEELRAMCVMYGQLQPTRCWQYMANSGRASAVWIHTPCSFCLDCTISRIILP